RLAELDRRLAIDKARAFILARSADPPEALSLLDADRISYTRDEADALASPLPQLSPRGVYWAAARLAMRIGGRLAAGIEAGPPPRLASGSTLDYVYRNQPQGAGPLGRLIDKGYLDSIGW